MNILIIGIVFLVFLIFGVILYLLFGSSVSKKTTNKSQIQNIMQAQRSNGSLSKAEMKANKLDKVLLTAEKKVITSGTMTIEKKLRYARWKMPPIVFRVLQVVISLVAVFMANIFFDWPIICFTIFTGPIVMNFLVGLAMNRRFKAFDKDYPSFLLNVVSMLRIGMNVVTAIQSAAEGLNPDSLVREEVTLMLDRLKLGVSEDKSIGAFGEDINHPEIELFVQAVILSRRLGGNLSDTLDRLSQQVRKRQFFRSSAEAAVSLQRGSIWVILGIMVALEGYILITSPDLIMTAIHDDFGWLVWQGAVVTIFIGILWVRQVTKIKV